MAATFDRTAGRITLSVVSDEVHEKILPLYFRLVGVATIGDTATVVDSETGQILFKGEASPGASDFVPYTKKNLPTGVKLTAITSGRVEIGVR
jgi:hypothetical protein